MRSTVERIARLLSSAAVTPADEVMVRHAQWVLKAEREQMKEEAACRLHAPRFWYRRWGRRRAYNCSLLREDSLEKLDAIGAEKPDLELILLRSQMDVV